MSDSGWGIDYSLRGRRIELIHTNDPYTKLKPGDKGTIKFEHQDSLSVMWDSGSALSMRECDGDRFRFLEDEVNEDQKGVIMENAAEYLEKATNCIYCSSDKIHISSGPEFIMNSVFLSIVCGDCRSSFTEEYALIAVHWDDEESVRKNAF